MEKHPGFRVAVEAARDEARRDALEDIKAAGQGLEGPCSVAEAGFS